MLHRGVIFTLTALGSYLGNAEVQVSPCLVPSTVAAHSLTLAPSAPLPPVENGFACRSTQRARLGAMDALQVENSTALPYTPDSGQYTAGSPGSGQSSESQFSAKAQLLSRPPRYVHSARVNRHGMGLLLLRLGPNGSTSTVAHAPEPPECWLLGNQLKRAGVNLSETKTYPSQSWYEKRIFCAI
eukprot:COSAG06_NODE_4960_length_3831_cov_5.211683_5_plen_185_part_00